MSSLVTTTVFAHVNREIWVVTAAGAERVGGLVATWVSQASIDENNPIVVIGIAANHFTRTLIDESGFFGLHLLKPAQIDLAINFAVGSGRTRDKFAGVNHRRSPHGTPLLQDIHTWTDCEVFTKLDTGDRIYYWANVIDGRVLSHEPPLREHEFISKISEEDRQNLRESRERDIEIQRPMFDAWRNSLPNSSRGRKS